MQIRRAVRSSPDPTYLRRNTEQPSPLRIYRNCSPSEIFTVSWQFSFEHPRIASELQPPVTPLRHGQVLRLLAKALPVQRTSGKLSIQDECPTINGAFIFKACVLVCIWGKEENHRTNELWLSSEIMVSCSNTELCLFLVQLPHPQLCLLKTITGGDRYV